RTSCFTCSAEERHAHCVWLGRRHRRFFSSHPFVLEPVVRRKSTGSVQLLGRSHDPGAGLDWRLPSASLARRAGRSNYCNAQRITRSITISEFLRLEVARSHLGRFVFL